MGRRPRKSAARYFVGLSYCREGTDAASAVRAGQSVRVRPADSLPAGRGVDDAHIGHGVKRPPWPVRAGGGRHHGSFRRRFQARCIPLRWDGALNRCATRSRISFGENWNRRARWAQTPRRHGSWASYPHGLVRRIYKKSVLSFSGVYRFGGCPYNPAHRWRPRRRKARSDRQASEVAKKLAVKRWRVQSNLSFPVSSFNGVEI